jgi:hypothetical protein
MINSPQFGTIGDTMIENLDPALLAPIEKVARFLDIT